MWDIIPTFINSVIYTAISIAEIGVVFGVAALFFKGISWVITKAKALAE